MSNSHHLVDSPLKLATCARCNAYVFAAMTSGLKIMADPAVLDLDGVREALIGSRGVFKLVTVAGRPHKLLRASTEALRAGTGPFVGEHTGCGVAGRNTKPVEPVEVDPHRAPAHSSPSAGAPLPNPVHEGCSTAAPTPGPSRAHSAKRSLSEYTCRECKQPLFEDEPYWAIQVGPMKWAAHDGDCKESP